MLPAYMTYGVAPQRRAVSKKWRGLQFTLTLPNSEKCFPKKNKNDPRKQFDPLIIPRVGFPEERQKKEQPEKPPGTTEAEFVRAQGLAGIHFARDIS